MKRLLLFDFDGLCVSPGDINIDSIVMKMNDALKSINLEPFSEMAFASLSVETTGTTELYLLHRVIEQKRVPLKDQEAFIKTYLLLRKTHLASADRKYESKIDLNLHDKTYPDAMHFAKSQRIIPDTTIRMVTGNPRGTMIERLRLDPDWKKIFMPDGQHLAGAFGDEGLSRQQLIELAIKRFEEEGFKVERDKEGYSTNVFYIADAVNDVVAAIKARTRMIFVPRNENKDPLVLNTNVMRRILHSRQAVLTEDEIDHAVNQRRMDGSERGVLYATNLFNPEVANFVRPEIWGSYEGKMKVQEEYVKSIYMRGRQLTRA